MIISMNNMILGRMLLWNQTKCYKSKTLVRERTEEVVYSILSVRNNNPFLFPQKYMTRKNKGCKMKFFLNALLVMV